VLEQWDRGGEEGGGGDLAFPVHEIGICESNPPPRKQLDEEGKQICEDMVIYNFEQWFGEVVATEGGLCYRKQGRIEG
jgi:hypothetical protein